MSQIIVVPLPEQAPMPEEQLAAQPVDGGLFEITSAPFVTYEVCKGDVVRCDDSEPPRFVEVVEPGGHVTLRVLYREDVGLMDRMKSLLALKEAGLVGEAPHGRYYALDAGPDVDLDAVLPLLDGWAEAEWLDFEIVGLD